MYEHDLHGRALLIIVIIVGRERGLVEAEREQDRRCGSELRQHARCKREEQRRSGKVD